MSRAILLGRHGAPQRALRYDIDTGEHVEISGDTQPVLTRGCYGRVGYKLVGLYASPEGPMVFVGRARFRVASADVELEVSHHEPSFAIVIRRGTERLEIAVVRPGRDDDDWTAVDDAAANLLAWLCPTLEARAQLIAEYTHPLALVEAGSIEELLAVGRRAVDLAGSDDGFIAAVRAAELDPEFPERSLIERTVGASAPWRGLAVLHRATAIATRHASRGARAIDLGWGVVAYYGRASEDGYVAVDVLAGRLRWTSRALEHHAGDRWLDAERQVWLRDPLTGAPTQIVETREELERERAFACHLGDCFVRIREIGSGNTNYGNEDPSDFDVYFCDAQGREKHILHHSGDYLSAHTVGNRIVVSIENSLVRVYAPDGTELWSRPGGYAGSIDDRIIVSANKWLRVHDADGKEHWACRGSKIIDRIDGRLVVSHPVAIVEPASGHELATVPQQDWGVDVFATDDVLAFASYNRTVAIARATLDPLWDRETPRVIAATASSLLAITDDGARHPMAQRVVALDPRDGHVASSLDVSAHRCDPRSAVLAAGKLVLLSFVGGPPIVVVD